MKKIVLLILVSVIPLFAQKVTVVEDVAVTNRSEGSFYYPTVTPDGTGLLYTTDGYQGLWYKNFASGKKIKITDAPGAGYEPGFSSKGSEVLFRENNFVRGKKFSSLRSYDLAVKKVKTIDEGIRDLKLCVGPGKRVNNYLKENSLRSIANPKTLQKVSAPELSVSIENSSIVVYEKEVKRTLEPMGQGNYIWPSVSPDGTKLLFTYMGKGTFVSSLEGTVLKNIGYANYPSWSPDGNWVVFMKDIDDGVRIISSDIYIANLNTGKYFNLTSGRNDITLYPKWGTTNSEIFYNTDDGQIRKIKLKFQ